MEKRKVSISVGGQSCVLNSDDSDEYLARLERRANEALKRTAGVAGASAHTNAICAVIALTDELMRTEQKIRRWTTERKTARNDPDKKQPAGEPAQNWGQISVWDVLEDQATD